MLLRSQAPKEEKEIQNVVTKIDDRPFIKCEGNVNYYTTLIDCAMFCEQILTKANTSEYILPLGFDLEWPFSFQTGPGKVAVVQISPSSDEHFVFHITEIKKLPKSLTELLVHPNVRLVGVNIKNDIRKLSRDFGGFDVDLAINNCIDAGSQANTLLGCRMRWSLEKLVEEFLNMRINKDKKVRNSKWHIIPLNIEQQIYAATDAYASLVLYNKLKILQDIANEQNCTKEN